MTEIVAVDIGGTHARFAIARVQGGRVTHLDEEVTLKTAEHASFQTAWEEFGRRLSRALPPAAAIAIAGPIQGEVLKLTNNPWVIRPSLIPSKLGAERYSLVNDFGAIAHAVAQLDDDRFTHLCGPDVPLPSSGVISIVGPGTGLGVAQLLRRNGHYHVIETEGGHIDYAPLDTLEDQILAHLRKHFRRVSVERIVSGQGVPNIYEALATIENRPIQIRDDKELWTAAMEGKDSLAGAAFDRFCLSLGAVAGDIALAQGAAGVVIAGGLGQRLLKHLPRSGFRDRFIAKGRFERRMDEMPVKLITHPQPGLFGAAAAFAAEHGE
ncbi:glucokinase [Sphingosinicella sp. BN140058]|uniref:glucokinase n=1 Tax=Sphingosinicella sp. BN140058 TaxID=1892855 RepID=UPI00101279DE|nr:glucokinase [Sphingosinicella sp. BN140058]QAY79480.1 glucokinase [Sphingosinicella sp. BN140058]